MDSKQQSGMVIVGRSSSMGATMVCILMASFREQFSSNEEKSGFVPYLNILGQENGQTLVVFSCLLSVFDVLSLVLRHIGATKPFWSHIRICYPSRIWQKYKLYFLPWIIVAEKMFYVGEFASIATTIWNFLQSTNSKKNGCHNNYSRKNWIISILVHFLEIFVRKFSPKAE